MSRRTEIQVGLTVLAALVILIAGVTWLKELSLAQKVRKWTVSFPQTGGLAVGNEVRVSGMHKGAVASMRLEGDHVLVRLALATDVQLTTTSHVAISNVGLMGDKVVSITLEPGGQPISERDVIQGEFELGVPEVMAEMGRSIDAVSAIASQLRELATTLEKEGDFRNTIHNFNETSEELKTTVHENRVLLHQTLEDFASAARTTKSLTTDKDAQLRHTLDQLSETAQHMNELSVRLDSLRGSMQHVAGRLDRGEGTLGKLVSDDSLYTQLHGTVVSLQALIEDVKKHPKRYMKLSIF